MMETKRVGLLGVPLETGASQRGTLMGPAALRTAGLVTVLRSLGFAVDDDGDIVPTPFSDEVGPAGVKNYGDISRWIGAISARTCAIATGGAIPIVMGGDHSLSMGSVNGMARYCYEEGRSLFVLWLDAHADYNTPHTTTSGNMHGMSLAFLGGEPGLDALLGSEPRMSLPPSQFDVFGVRSIDPAEKVLMRDRNVRVVDMRHIDEFGVGVPLRAIIERVKAANGVLHVSFDVDFLDPTIAPGVGTTVPGGTTYREAHLVMELLHDSGLVRSLDIVELNPFLDERGRTARVAVELVASLFGQQIVDRVTPTNAIG